MARFLFIVARQLPSVYEHLCQQFGREPNVEVIMDRRKGDRREPEAAAPPPGPERREGDAQQNDSPGAIPRLHRQVLAVNPLERFGLGSLYAGGGANA